MPRFLPALFLLAALLALLVPSSTACSCIPTPPAYDALALSDAVFAGRVISVNSTETGKRVLLAVREAWKGVARSKVQVRTAPHSAMCGFTFDVGRKYLVYARKSDGVLEAGLCSRTSDFWYAADDLAMLGEPERRFGGRSTMDAVDELAVLVLARTQPVPVPLPEPEPPVPIVCGGANGTVAN
ncbi:hypothetical protein DFJ74DRAFT_674903 [Hyaloraphidium curvatum]|nr:hypothetical protein DFJ74DRAFT_674903 [Hyaloraphidium curvatum]